MIVWLWQQEAKTKNLSAANRSKENEAKELVDRIGELEVQRKSQDEDAAIADAARRAAVEVMLTSLLPLICVPYTASIPLNTSRRFSTVQLGLRPQLFVFVYTFVRITQIPNTGHGVAEG